MHSGVAIVETKDPAVAGATVFGNMRADWIGSGALYSRASLDEV